MNFNLTEEQQMLQDSLRRFLANEYGFDKRGKIIESGEGLDRTTWNAFAEMGLLGFTFPEDYDGLGGNAIDTMLVMDCFGRALVVEPYLATVVLGGGLIRDAGSEAQKAEILPKIAAGEHFLALAHSEPGARYNLTHVKTAAMKDGDGFLLSGRKTAVIHGAQADQLIVSARTDGKVGDAAGLSLFLVDRTAPGLTLQDFATHDGLRTAEVHLDNVRVKAGAVIGEIGDAAPAIEKMVDLGIAALCAEAVGAMEALNETTLEYIKTRKQFGVPIGKFQVLQHRMADMFIAAEQAKSMAILAASEADSDDRAKRREAISMAKTLVGQSARYVGQQAVQLHGGMGVTEEMFAAHLFKRLTLINLLFGDTDHHLAQVSDGLLKSA
ncbi:pimeloyl-CoA dehydrogenase small subunit [Marinobacter nanhaiticus D15-8W]|uniref:Acyl-CoA dehydrogenase n=1 Tax=Marinobacter nanhaiticus D15-8W TaxID=626887 RepID=N6X2R3_9GAMM|nr:acyl-CoA dehydrogenase [Marinobacter nanhaiticus]ENO15373.1 acyl-CoA dehydrogenase [Marinobacter nanhaiticus D15-8W]BES73781.1 pimeloyl-CoA dehydrogenase small subunit [Marinobacter nanhaiticus D15-8W]